MKSLCPLLVPKGQGLVNMTGAYGSLPLEHSTQGAQGPSQLGPPSNNLLILKLLLMFD